MKTLQTPGRLVSCLMLMIALLFLLLVEANNHSVYYQVIMPWSKIATRGDLPLERYMEKDRPSSIERDERTKSLHMGDLELMRIHTLNIPKYRHDT